VKSVAADVGLLEADRRTPSVECIDWLVNAVWVCASVSRFGGATSDEN